LTQRFYFYPLENGAIAKIDFCPFAYVSSDGQYWVSHYSLGAHGFGKHIILTGISQPIVPDHEFDGGKDVIEWQKYAEMALL
jgi:hypothetical protein